MTTATSILLDGLTFGESPRWHDGRLWLSDFYAHRVLSVGETGDVRVELELDDRPSGLGWMPDGSLLVVGMTERRLWRRRPGGGLTLHADLGTIATGDCNDLVVDRRGRAYVGNFGFDLHRAIADGRGAEVLADPPLADLARVDPDGTVHVAARGLRFPNGAAVAPDGGTLIVAETFGKVLTAFDVAPDGALSRRRVWADLGTRMPDGICLDAAGAVWAADAITRECVRVAEGGAVLDVVDTVETCYAAMLGGGDGRTLFLVTAPPENTPEAQARRHGRVRMIEVAVPRAGLP